jgi:hypothetical protein
MAKAKTKRRAAATAKAPSLPTAAEQLQAARREMRQLRELKALMNQIRRRRLDSEANGVQLAHVLVAGTEYIVLSELRVKQLEHDCRESYAEVARLAKELHDAKQQLNPETV